MTVHPICQEEPYNPGQDVSINPNKNSILTPQRPVPDVRLGYTSTGQKQEVQLRERAVVSHEWPFGWLLAYEFFRFVRYPPLFLPATPSEHDRFARVEV